MGKKGALIGFLLLMYGSVPVWPQGIQDVSDTAKVRGFARVLEAEGDYFRAASEYKRLLYLNSDPIQKDSLRYTLAALYDKMGYYKNGMAVLSKVSDTSSSSFRQARAVFSYKLGDYALARAYWIGKDSLVALAYLREGNDRLVQRILPGYKLPHRKLPFIAGLLSAVVPGLGRIYDGRWADGLMAFTLIASSGLAAYHYNQKDNRGAEAFYGGLTAAFYLGDIYGSAMGAEIYNRRERERAADELEDMTGVTSGHR